MAVQREAIFVALFDRLTGVADFNYTSRVQESWDDTPPAATPALFLAKGPEEGNIAVQGMPELWRLHARCVIYVDNTEATHEPPQVAPSTLLNELLTLIEAALERGPTDGPLAGALFANNPMGGTFGTTLGGLCYSCQIVGTIEVFEGFIAGRAAAIIPIEILTTA